MEPELNIVTSDQAGQSSLVPPWAREPSQVSPIGFSSPPSYVDIARKKSAESSGSSNEDSIDQLSKKAGRKSKKEIWEEEDERLETQGIHPTIEISYGRNKRTRPPKGVITPSQLGK